MSEGPSKFSRDSGIRTLEVVFHEGDLVFCEATFNDGRTEDLLAHLDDDADVCATPSAVLGGARVGDGGER